MRPAPVDYPCCAMDIVASYGRYMDIEFMLSATYGIPFIERTICAWARPELLHGILQTFTIKRMYRFAVDKVFSNSSFDFPFAKMKVDNHAIYIVCAKIPISKYWIVNLV